MNATIISRRNPNEPKPASKSLKEAMASLGDFGLAAEVLAAVYDSDVTQDGVWSMVLEAGCTVDDISVLEATEDGASDGPILNPQ